MRYVESVTKVLTTPAEWQEWLSAYIAERHLWLASQGCSGCYSSPDKVQAPDRYPVLVILNAGSAGYSLDYIYKDQLIKLLYLPDRLIEEPAECAGPIIEERSI